MREDTGLNFITNYYGKAKEKARRVKKLDLLKYLMHEISPKYDEKHNWKWLTIYLIVKIWARASWHLEKTSKITKLKSLQCWGNPITNI